MDKVVGRGDAGDLLPLPHGSLRPIFAVKRIGSQRTEGAITTNSLRQRVAEMRCMPCDGDVVSGPHQAIKPERSDYQTGNHARDAHSAKNMRVLPEKSNA